MSYEIWNNTDNISADPDVYDTEEAAAQRIVELRDRYRKQGYYRDNNWNKIAPEDIQYQIRKI